MLDKDVEYLCSLIEGIVDRKLKSQNDVERFRYGKVVSVNSDNTKASVKIAGDDGETGMIINETGKTLSVGDSVKVYLSGTNINNAYIGIKF